MPASGGRAASDHALEQRRELQQRKLISEAERAILGPEQRRDHECPPLRIVMLAEILEQLGRNDLGLDPERILEAAPERFGHRKRVVQRLTQRFAALLQLRIMVALRLDVVTDPGFRSNQGARVDTGLLVRRAEGAPLKLAQSGVEADDAFRDRGRVVGEFDQFGAADPEVGEHRVGENLGELVGAGRIAAFRRERLHVDVEGFGKPKEDAGGHRPLVPLEMVEVGGRDADLVGHGRLVEAPVAPKPSQPCPQEQLPLCNHGQIVNEFTKYTSLVLSP